MGAQLDLNTLGFLGIDYQYRLVKCFIEEPKFYSNISNIVAQNSFTDSLLRKFVGTLKDYYEKNGLVPSYETMLIFLRSRTKTQLEYEEWDGLINKLRYETTVEGVCEVKDLALRFFKQQSLIKAANQVIEIAKNGSDRFDSCLKIFEDAITVTDDDDLGYSPFDKEEEALSPSYTVHIPTGIKLLDQELGGGLAKGKVGVIIGSSGFGKTTMSTAMSCAASTFRCDINNHQGFKVLQIYFEDTDVDITKKVFSNITKVETKDITRNIQQIDEIRDVLNNYKDRDIMHTNYRLKSFPAHKKTTNDIRTFLRKLINSGFRPDLVIIDYFECLAPEKGGFQNDSQWQREANTMRDLENIAKEFNIAMWVPTQGNKESMVSPDIVTMDKAGGSIVKIQAASVILSIARSVEMQQNNVATLALLKNRGGSLRTWKNIEFNNGTSTISCDNVIVYNDALAYEEDEKRAREQYQIEVTRSVMNAQRNTNCYQPKIGEQLPPI